MSIKLTRRIAGRMLKRGVSNVRIKAGSLEDAKKAITSSDVKALIDKGGVYALPKKHNISARGKILKKKRNQGRSRGPGRRKGTKKARGGVEYKKRIRGQRRVLKELRRDKLLDGALFRKLYLLVKGGNFSNKATLLNHVRSRGVEISDEKFEKLRHM